MGVGDSKGEGEEVCVATIKLQSVSRAHARRQHINMPSIADVCMKVDSLAEPVAVLECEIATHALMVLSSLSYNLLEGGADDTAELLEAMSDLVNALHGTDLRGAAEELSDAVDCVSWDV